MPQKSRKIKIANKWVGDRCPCFIIAEAGSNHDRKLSQAKELIDVAAEAGVDAVKFQIYKAQSLYSKKLKTLPGEKEKPFDVIKKIETPRDWIPKLYKYAEKKGLIFFASPFDKEAVDSLDPYVPAFKWASPELIDRPLFEHAAKKKKPMIISTGFYSLAEVKDAVKWAHEIGNKRLILFHCTGLYPTHPEEVNLKAILTLKKEFNLPVGLSDHTTDTVTPAVAVGIGANIIEKHYTLDKELPGPDHPFALEPGELKEMVTNIRNIEKSLGTGIKKPVEREVKKEKLIRQGIVAIRNIKKGEKLTIGNITTKRVGEGAILPKYYYDVLAKEVLTDVETDQRITWEIIKK